MSWLKKFSDRAKGTDRLTSKPDHLLLLATGLMGEAGSVLTELKKTERELKAYPVYRQKMFEEVGDFLWYLTRTTETVAPDLINELKLGKTAIRPSSTSKVVSTYLELGSLVGQVLDQLRNDPKPRGNTALKTLLIKTWASLDAVSSLAKVSLEKAAERNLQKVESRWPQKEEYAPLFDNDVDEEERIPRELEIEYRERIHGSMNTVFLRCNNLNFGDRLTDNIEGEDDGYRFHDVFHFAYAVHLGWSPVIRALLKCKRKSLPKTDEGQDGARATIVEEAVSAIVFSRAKNLNHYDGLDHVDYDLLKTVSEFVQGFEVDQIPLWQWEKAILEGNRLFRLLRLNRGGTIRLDLVGRSLDYTAPSSPKKRNARK